MKKYFLGILAVVALFISGAALTTNVVEIGILDTLASATAAVDADLAAATGFGIGAVTGEVDLASVAGSEKGTFANAIVLTLRAAGAADGDTLTQKIYGRSENGGPHLIASIVWTIGTARADGATATLLWADTAVVTDTHLTEVKTADAGGNDRIASVSFDVAGYRYIKSLITAQTGDPTTITVFYRYY